MVQFKRTHKNPACQTASEILSLCIRGGKVEWFVQPLAQALRFKTGCFWLVIHLSSPCVPFEASSSHDFIPQTDSEAVMMLQHHLLEDHILYTFKLPLKHRQHMVLFYTVWSFNKILLKLHLKNVWPSTVICVFVQYWLRLISGPSAGTAIKTGTMTEWAPEHFIVCAHSSPCHR